MAFINVSDKMTAAKALMNDWLKDQTFYCANCGDRWFPEVHIHESCCQEPLFGRNIDHTMMLVKLNKEVTKDLKKSTGATENDSMRLGVNMPPQLYSILNNYFKKHGEKGLFNDQKDLRKFMRAFPQFTIPERI